MDVNQTYCGDHFTIYIDIEALYGTPETSVMLCVNYILIKTKQEQNRGCPALQISLR